MTALVLYESMFGNTRRIAEAIGDGLAEVTDVRVDLVSAVADLTADLVVIGAPTHAHSLPRPSSREDAATWSRDAEKHLALEPDAAAPGVREWLDALTTAPVAWAARTRFNIPCASSPVTHRPRSRSGCVASAPGRLHRRSASWCRSTTSSSPASSSAHGSGAARSGASRSDTSPRTSGTSPMK